MNGAVGKRMVGGTPRSRFGGARHARMPRATFRAGLLAVAALVGGCAQGPHVLNRVEQHVIDRQYVEYPPNYEFRRYIAGLTAPTAFDIDTEGNVIVALDGMGGGSPQIIGFRPDHTIFNVFPVNTGFFTFGSGFRIYGPIGGLRCYKGKIYVSHRDENDFGVITAFDYSGGHRTVVAGLPAQGEYGVTQIAVDPKADRLYFGVGTATNSGVVGLDDWEIGWVRYHPDVCDLLGRDRIRTSGPKFSTSDPGALLFGSELGVTGPFQFFNHSSQTLIRKRTDKANGCIFSVPAGGGPVKIEATGVHYPRGLAFSQFGLYFTNDGMEPRGSRPIMNDPCSLLVCVPGTDYRWPDYTTNLQPVNDPSGKYQPPQSMVIKTGYYDIDMLINADASGLVAPAAGTLLQGVFPSLSGAAGVTFVPENSGLSNDFAGNAIVALSGDTAPFANSGLKLQAPIGYKVMRVDVDRKQVYEFIHNTQNLPASKIKGATADELERPIDVKIGPDGALYILDLGRMVTKEGKPEVATGTGQIFRLMPTPPPPVSTTQP